VRSGAGGAGGDADALRGALDAALRDNAILKRAVAIQNARLQELGTREGGAAALCGALDAARGCRRSRRSTQPRRSSSSSSASAC